MSPRSFALPVVVLALSLGADATLPNLSPVSLEGYGGEVPGCIEWTDGCAVCRRIAGRPHCSTPGFACTAGPLACTAASRP